MLEVKVEGQDLFNEDTEEWIRVNPTVLKLEHSLISVSKWETIYKKAFLGREEKTAKEILDYVKCMTLSPKEPSDLVYTCLTNAQIKEIFDYVNDTKSATTVKHIGGKKNNELITSELVYYWMFANQIPMDCEKWHFSRLMKLIEIFSAKNQPDKKMPRREALSKQAALNKARRAKLGTRG